MNRVVLSGMGLHRGQRCAVTLERRAGPTALATEAHPEALPPWALAVARLDRGVRLRMPSGDEVELVEHLLAALGGLGLHQGVRAHVIGGEVPLLDGGAALFAAALGALGVAPTAPTLRVVRAGALTVGESRYRFAPATADGAPRVRAEIDFPGVGPQAAEWRGGAADFTRRIAPARTFGWRHEAEALRAAGRAAHVDPSSVLVLDGAAPPGAATAAPGDELARHKLLDLIGDLFLHGGPPEGAVHATRPGHAATHAAVTRALAEGILAQG